MIYNINTEDGIGMISLLKEISKTKPIVIRMSMVDDTDIPNILEIINGVELTILEDMHRATSISKKLITDGISKIDTSNKTIVINNVIQYENTI